MRTSQDNLRKADDPDRPTSHQIRLKRIRELARVTLASLFILITLYLTNSLWLPLIYNYLDVSQAPQSADFLVMLGGGSGDRAKKVVELYLEGYAPYVICSGGHPEIDSDLSILKKGGIPDERIIVNDQATHTWDEAQQVLAILQAKKAHSALIVTNAFHTRRAQATYQKFNSVAPINLIFVSADLTPHSDDWWHIPSLRSTVLIEYVKTIYYFFHYGISTL